MKTSTFNPTENCAFELWRTIKTAMKVIVEVAGITDDSAAEPNVAAVDDGLPPGASGTVDVGSVDGDQ